MVGRQRLSRVRPWLTACLLPIPVAIFALFSRAHPAALAGLFGGIAIGVALGVYGLRVTRYEETAEGLFYTPSAHLGIALSLLLVGRVVYRLFTPQFMPSAVPASQANVGNNPLTPLIFGTLAGYYVTFAIGLLRWRRQIASRAGDVESPQSDPPRG